MKKHKKFAGPGQKILSRIKAVRQSAEQHYTESWQETRTFLTFWPVTWPFLGAELAVIPHLKEGYLG